MPDTMTSASTKILGTALLDRIGNTPLIRLDRLTAHLPGIQLLGKVEWVNPGGSVKDRAASAIVTDAQRKGLLTPGKALLDATSGNTGIAYAMLGSAMNFPVALCMPSNVSPERKNILAAYGAQIIWTDPADGSDGAIRKARALAAAEPEKYFYADQYSNENNWRAHYNTTANEIWEQTAGRVTHFIAGLGTSGTFMGTTRRLHELNPAIQCVSMQPDSPFNGFEGLKHMATAIVPPIYDPNLADRNIDMPTERAYITARRLGKMQGLLVGVSAAGAVTAALDIAEEEARAGREAVIVAILCDSADKYLSERFWSEPTEEEAAADAVDSGRWVGQRA
ncbi:MAG: cysteine synthase family protein [Acidobacteria bacterium]|nr:cysteine synthase family protein [Acidobacteriota bacterium]